MTERSYLQDVWIVIPNWEKWQPRRDRHDPWIKSYVDQLRRDEYLDLSLAERGLLENIRHLYSTQNGLLRARSLPGLVQQKVRRVSLERLSDAGFIQLSAAKPPPIRRGSAARARGEGEIRESQRPLVVSEGEKQRADAGEDQRPEYSLSDLDLENMLREVPP